jgi:uncharacterized 2Fe-2S/4Fe-4S cluster protein (DUF4445 family)
MADIKLTFKPEEREVRVPARQATIVQAAAEAGIIIQTPCGGLQRCGKCAVRFLAGAPAPTPAERKLLSREALRQGMRLSCVSRPAADGVIEVPAAARVVRPRILVEGVGRELALVPNVRKVYLELPPPSLEDQRSDLSRLITALGGLSTNSLSLALLRELPGVLRGADFRATSVLIGDHLVGVEPGDTANRSYGLAFDVGTTTVVGYLLDLNSGGRLGVASGVNPQARHGDDVISRVQFATTRPEGLATLQARIVECLNQLTARVCQQAGISPESVYEMTAVGNTCMMHLLLGLSVAGLAGSPFVPVVAAGQELEAAQLGLRLHPRARLRVLPNIAGFVGADTVGVILATELESSKGLRIAVDIGTNGEVVVAQEGRLLACSTAAGPAFEGARIQQGMPAAAGAIDRIEVEGDELLIHTLEEAPARGLCGSGVIDAVAALLRLGLITESGRLLDPESEEAARLPEKVRSRLRRNGNGSEFVLVEAAQGAEGVPVCLTARDVREVQLGKSAICAGIGYLLAEVGARPSEVEELLLAGAFGSYIRRESAVAIGLLPELPLERIRSVGNAAGSGAQLALLSVPLREKAERIAREAGYVEISDRREWYDLFAELMRFRPQLGES